MVFLPFRDGVVLRGVVFCTALSMLLVSGAGAAAAELFVISTSLTLLEVGVLLPGDAFGVGFFLRPDDDLFLAFDEAAGVVAAGAEGAGGIIASLSLDMSYELVLHRTDSIRNMLNN